MDRLIARFDAQPDNDLMITQRGVAYQRDMSKGRIVYGAKYFEQFQAYAGSETERALNAGRCAMLLKHLPAGASALDVGIGSGAFLRAARALGFDAKGFDINQVAVDWLKESGLYADDAGEFQAVTLWDCIEHMEEPELFLRRVQRGAYLFAAIPAFDDLSRVRGSKHYKPGEHLYYWTDDGFVSYMAAYGFRLIERSAHETDAGRENIGAYAFVRDLPDYRDHIAAYTEMHATRHYGSSATELHLSTVAKVVRRLRPHSIVDYGCGRSDLVAHFWRDGERVIARYDPAIPTFKEMPGASFDLVLCCDVMEHIPLSAVDKVLGQVRRLGRSAVFTISTKLARAKLPDGRNAHVTLLTKTEWMRWIKSVFGKVETLPSSLEHELIVLATS